MTDETNKMNTLIAACWKDDALKQRFLSDPHAVLAEHGMDVPEGINVNVVENTDTTVHVTLPAAPTANGDLSDEELENAAGGHSVFGCRATIPSLCGVRATCNAVGDRDC
jgi:hypothetical protein